MTVEGDVLSFGGERKLAQDVGEKHWRRIERRYGKVQSLVLAAAHGQCGARQCRVQGRNADGNAAATRRGEAQAGFRQGCLAHEHCRTGRRGGDARTFVPHEADGGGRCPGDLRRGRPAREGPVIYDHDRPAYYLFGGEWYTAISDTWAGDLSPEPTPRGIKPRRSTAGDFSYSL